MNRQTSCLVNSLADIIGCQPEMELEGKLKVFIRSFIQQFEKTCNETLTSKYQFLQPKKYNRTKLLAKCGFHIFRSYERQFIKLVGSNKNLEICSKEAVERIINYISNITETNIIETDPLTFLTKAVVKGSSEKKGDNKMDENMFSSEIFEMPGVIEELEEMKYFSKGIGDFKKYEYRRLFSWETDSWETIKTGYKDGIELPHYSYEMDRINEKFFVKTILRSLNEEEKHKKLAEQVQKTINARLKERKSTRLPLPDSHVWFEVKQPPQWFTGREKELEQIRRFLEDCDMNCVVVYGKAGMGKTDLVAQFVGENYNHYDSNVIWISARSKDALVDTFKRLAEDKLRMSSVGKEEVDSELVQRVYDKLADKKCLFVFDDVDNSESFEGFLPTFKNHFKIITSRSPNWKCNKHQIKVSRFSDQEIREYLCRYLKVEHQEQDEHMDEILKEVRNDSVSLLVSRIERKHEQYPTYSFKDYLVELQESNIDMNSNNRALLLTFDEIEKETNGRDALHLLDMLSYIDSTDVPIKLFEEKISTEVIAILVNKNIIAKSFNDTLSVKRYIQRMRIKLAVEKDTEKEILIRLLQLLSEQMKNRESAEQFIPHITELWRHAVHYGDLITEYILEPNKTLYTTFFHLIVGSNKSEVVKTLLKKIKNDHSETLVDLIRYRSMDDGVPLHNAALRNNCAIIELLLGLGADINATKQNDWTPLLLAVKNNNTDVAEYLIDRGADVSKTTNQRNTPLHLATRNHNIKLVQKLLKNAKTDVNASTKDGFTALHTAAKNGFNDLVQLLLTSRAGINCVTKENFTPLHFAVQKGHLETVQILLEHDADVNMKTAKNFSPLYMATRNNAIDIAECLIEHGAPLNMTNDQRKYTALHNACYNGEKETVQFLKEKKVDLNHKTSKELFTALHFAVLNNRLDVVEILLDGEGDVKVNATTSQKNTPLHLAAIKGSLDIVKLLLSKGANVELKNVDKDTALDCAKLNNRSQVVQYISEYSNKKKSLAPIKYKKRAGAGGVLGQIYEIQMNMFFLLQSEKSKEQFVLASNMDEIGDLDDVVFKHVRNGPDTKEACRIIFLQAKHKETEKRDINLKSLLSGSDSICLVDYFKSYLTIKQKFQNKDDEKHLIFNDRFEDCEFIVYTNTWLKSEKDPDFIKHETDTDDFFKEIENGFYTLSPKTEDQVQKALEYAADSKSLAEELVDAIINPQRNLGLENKPSGNYQVVLLNKVIEKMANTKKGKFKEEFLSGNNVEDTKFREIFFDELLKKGKFKEKSREDLIQYLKAVELRITSKFGEVTKKTERDELPYDVIDPDDIKDFVTKFKLFVNQPNVEKFEKTIKNMIKKEYNVDSQDLDSVYSDVLHALTGWFGRRNHFLTDQNIFFEKYALKKLPLTYFTRRGDKNQIRKKLKNKKELIICGPTGIGKSTLIRSLMNENKSKFGEFVLIDAADETSMGYCFRNLAEKVVSETNKFKKIEDVASEVYKHFEDKESVFLFDNYERRSTEMKLISMAPKNIFKIFNITCTGGHGKEDYFLHAFKEDESIDFILKSISQTEPQISDVKALSEELKRYPLALTLAVSCIREEYNASISWGKDKYCIQNFLQDLNGFCVDESCLDNETSDELKVLFKTFSVTLIKMSDKYAGDRAREILKVLAYLHPNMIPMQNTFQHLVHNEEELHSSVELLTRYSLVNLDRGFVNIHPCFQRFVRALLKKQEIEDQFIRITQDLLFQNVLQPHDEYQHRFNRSLNLHFEKLLSSINSSSNVYNREQCLKNVVTWTALEAGSVGNVERETELLEKAIQMWKDCKTFELGKLMHIMADNYGLLGQFTQQKEMLKQSLQMFEEKKNAGEIVQVLLDLADASGCSDNEKIEYLNRALNKLKESKKEDRRSRLLLSAVKKKLSSVYEQSNISVSITHLEEAVELQKEVLGKYHHEVARGYAELSQICMKSGETQKADENRRRVWMICDTHYEPNHKECLEIRNIINDNR